MTPFSEHQLGAMLSTFSEADVSRFDVGAFDHLSGRMSVRECWTRAQVWRSRGWIAARNASGSSLYIRPARELELSPWLLFDELTEPKLGKIKSLRPGLVVETSPGLYQVWCRLCEPVDVDLRTAIGRDVAGRYGGDLGDFGGNPFGRLAGTTNRRRSLRQANGLYPFATLRHASGVVAAIDVPQAQKAAVSGAARAGKREDAGAARGAGPQSQSARDFAVACRLAEYGRGDAEIEAVIRALRTNEEALQTDYINRTIRQARARVQRPHNPGSA